MASDLLYFVNGREGRESPRKKMSFHHSLPGNPVGGKFKKQKMRQNIVPRCYWHNHAAARGTFIGIL